MYNMKGSVSVYVNLYMLVNMFTIFLYYYLYYMFTDCHINFVYISKLIHFLFLLLYFAIATTAVFKFVYFYSVCGVVSTSISLFWAIMCKPLKIYEINQIIQPVYVQMNRGGGGA